MSFPTICGTSLPIVTLQAALCSKSIRSSTPQVRNQPWPLRRTTPLIAISIAGLAAAHVAVLASAFTSTASLSGARVVAHFESRLA
jgi:hypothetical protein